MSVTSKFQCGDHVMVPVSGARGKLVGLAAPYADVVFDGHRQHVPLAMLRFDGDPPLHPDTGRPTSMYRNNTVWPRQPELTDYVLHVFTGGAWTISVGDEPYAAGGRGELEDNWRETMLPAHRAWLQALIHEHGQKPGQYHVSAEDVGVARDGGLHF